MKPMERKNAAYRELESAKKAEAKGKQLPIGGKSAKMGEPFYGDRKSAEAAYDKVQNLREENREVSEERLRRATADTKKYAKGGTVDRGYGLARSGKKCKMV